MNGREMSASSGRGRDRGRSWLRWAGALAAMAMTGLLATACGGGPSPAASAGESSSATGGSTSSPSGVAYSRCMRSHGLPKFPDPDAKGNYPAVDPQHLGVSDSLYQAAEQACQPLLPTGGSLQQQTNQCLWFGNCPPALLQQLLNIEREYARCMRTHGVPNWPDPTINKGRPAFDLGSAGIDAQSTDSSQFMAKDDECRRLVGGSVPELPYTS
jgi:hypothetical protein